MRLSALAVLLRPSRGNISTVLLPTVAFTLVSAVTYITAALARLFWIVPDERFDQYKVLAVGLLAVLVVPASTLGTSAARLSARRRVDRLAVLRLLGAPSSLVRGLAVAEASLLAGAGALAGLVGYVIFVPMLSWLAIAGQYPQFATLWLPLWAIPLLTCALTAIAAVSAAVGLRRVIISPLGVRMRMDIPRIRRVRLLAGAAVLACATAVLQLTSASWGAAQITVAIVLVLIAVMSVLNIVGPFLVSQSALKLLARARTVPGLIAARSVLESPTGAWRQVAGVGLASFIAVPAGSVFGFLEMVQSGPTALSLEQLTFFGDIRTVVIAAVVGSFLLVACSVGVTQVASILEQRSLYISLDRLGMPLRAMERSRRLAVASPLLVAATFPALSASVLFAPVVGVSIFTAPFFIVTVVACIALGVSLVQFSVAATAPVLRRVLGEPDRAL